MPAITVHPEIQILREKRRSLLLALAEIVEENRRIREEINPKALARYDELFRELEVKIQRETLAERELARRAELFALKRERGEKLSEKTIELVNALVDSEFRRLRERMAEAFEMDKSERNRARAERLAQAEAEEAPLLYRTIVKKLHPDSPDSDAKHFQKFWEEAQTAYKQNNLHRLRSIHELVKSEEEAVEFLTVEELALELEKIERQIADEEKKLREIKENEPFTLAEFLENADWIRAHRRELEARLAQIESEAERRRTALRELLGKNWDKTDQSEKEKKDEKFFDDFMDNAYFNRR